jgi:cation diffusion facilitator family transporter
VETEDSRKKSIVRVSVVGIVANVALAAFKATIGILSHSIAITLDAVNNLSDAASSAITIVGTKLAGKPADREHPYGFGRVEYLTTIVVASIVLWAGLTSLKESVDGILSPQTPSYDTISLVIVGAAVDIIWLFCLPSTGIYELFPGFVAGAIAAIIATLVTKEPSKEVTDIFDKATAPGFDE